MCSSSTYNEVSSKIGYYCGKICPLECYSIEYLTSTSTADFPSDQYVNRLLNYSFVKIKYPNASVSDLKSDLLSFSVYYPELKYTVMSQTPQHTIADFISNIGGTMGNIIITTFEILPFY